MTPSAKTITTFCHLHPLVEVDFPYFVDNFHPKTNLVLDRKEFIYALTCFSRLSFSSPLGMVYEFLQDCFVLDDSASGFDLFFEICGDIACGHVFPSVSHLLVAS
jgi:hypothetical protein